MIVLGSLLGPEIVGARVQRPRVSESSPSVLRPSVEEWLTPQHEETPKLARIQRPACYSFSVLPGGDTGDPVVRIWGEWKRFPLKQKKRCKPQT
eukprot:1410310-Rhodomonas_salina.1